MTFRRKTLGAPVSFEGRGLHHGSPVRVTLHPGESGIWFRTASERVQACPQNVADTNRCTQLGGISTIEHLMAAFAGLEITDVEVELSASELPALDGSAKPYAQGIGACGLTDLGEAEFEGLFTRIFVQSERKKLAVSAGEGRWRYEYCSERWPYFQVFGTQDIVRDFGDEIAPARTFGHEADVPAIQAAGLAKGLDLNSALLLGEEGYANEPLFPTEPARHKLLDAMGDLYLAGIPLRFLNVVAQRTGHRMNVEAAAQLMRSRPS